MKEKGQDMFHPDSTVFHNDGAEETKKKHRRKRRYGKRKSGYPEMGRNQEQHGTHPLEETAGEQQDVQTAEESVGQERLKAEERNREAALNETEHLKQKESYYARQKWEDVQEALEEKTGDSGKCCSDSQSQGQPTETDFSDTEANTAEADNTFSHSKVNTAETDSTFYYAGADKRATGGDTFSESGNFSEMPGGREKENSGNRKKTKAAYSKLRNRKRYRRNERQHFSKEDERQGESRNFTDETSGNFSSDKASFLGQ